MLPYLTVPRSHTCLPLSPFHTHSVAHTHTAALAKHSITGCQRSTGKQKGSALFASCNCLSASGSGGVWQVARTANISICLPTVAALHKSQTTTRTTRPKRINGTPKKEEGTQRGRSSQKMATKMVHKSDKWRTQKRPFHIRYARRKCPKGHTHTQAKGLSNTGNWQTGTGTL